MFTSPTPGKATIREFGGLEIEVNPTERPSNTWQVLTNLDQFVSGSIRKTAGMAELLPGQVYDSPIVVVKSYRRVSSDPLTVIGVSQNGTIYNLLTGAVLGNFPFPVTFPFAAIMDGTADGVSSNPGPGSDGDIISYLVSTIDNQLLYKWDGVNPPTPVGIVGPQAGDITIQALGVTATQSRGIAILVSRKYRMTFWNPTTKQESSPSDDFTTAGAFQSIITSSSPIGIPAAFPYLTTVELAIKGPASLPGYSMMRVYATRDGSDEFFLVSGLISNTGTDAAPVYVQADSDNAIPFPGPEGAVVYDGIRDHLLDPIFVGTAASDPFGSNDSQGNVINSRTPAPDPLLVQPAPDLEENNPPPIAVWGAVYKDRLFLVPRDDQSNLIFSKIGNFESYPGDNSTSKVVSSTENILGFTSDEFDPITALDGQEQQLVVGKLRSLHSLIGTDFTDFAIVELDPKVGVLGRRAMTSVPGALLLWSNRGIVRLTNGPAEYYGRSVRPITDDVNRATLLSQTFMAVDTQRDIALISVVSLSRDQATLLLADLSQPAPFSVYGVLPSIPYALEEVELPDGTTVILGSFVDGGSAKVFKLFVGTDLGGDTVQAEALSQPLPSEDVYSRKVFRVLRIQGDIDPGWQYACSVDKGPLTVPQPLSTRNSIGLTGKQLVIQFTHGDVPTLPEVQLDNFEVEYTTIGESR